MMPADAKREDLPEMLSDDFRRVLRSEGGMIHPARSVLIFGGVGIVRAADVGLELGGSFAKIMPAAEQFAPVSCAEGGREFPGAFGHGGGVGLQSLPIRSGPPRQAVSKDWF